MTNTVVCLLLAGSLQAPSGWDLERTQLSQLLLDGKTEDAVAHLEAAVERHPDNAEAQYFLGNTLLTLALERAGDPLDQRRPLLMRAVTHFRRAEALDPAYAELMPFKLTQVYGEGGLDDPAELEQLARQLIASRPESVVWHVTLADALVRQDRRSDAARTLVAAASTVGADDRVTLGMTLADRAREWTSLSVDEVRPMFETAARIADELLAATPDDRDALMLKSGAHGMFAERLPAGEERSRLEAESTATFDRFYALAPPAAESAPDPDAPILQTFSDIRAHLDAGHVKAAADAFAAASATYQASPAFWREAAVYHTSRGDDPAALDAARTRVRLAGSDPDALAWFVSYAWEYARTAGPPEASRRQVLEEGLTTADRALVLDPEHLEATTYRGLLLRVAAELEPNPSRRQALLADADAMKAQAAAILERRKTP